MLHRVLSVTENTVAALAFATITIVAFANVISRYFLNASLAFTSEITVNVVVWLTMIGAVIGVREGSHLGFSLLHDRLMGRAHQVVTVLIAAAMVLFFVMVLWFGLELALQQRESGRATFSIGIPQWLFTLALPVGSALGILRAIQVSWWSLGSDRKRRENMAEGTAIG